MYFLTYFDLHIQYISNLDHTFISLSGLGLTIPLRSPSYKKALSKLGLYYERMPSGENSLFKVLIQIQMPVCTSI